MRLFLASVEMKVNVFIQFLSTLKHNVWQKNITNRYASSHAFYVVVVGWFASDTNTFMVHWRVLSRKDLREQYTNLESYPSRTWTYMYWDKWRHRCRIVDRKGHDRRNPMSNVRHWKRWMPAARWRRWRQFYLPFSIFFVWMDFYFLIDWQFAV